MSKMSEVMPKWGPYSKKYSGVSRVTEHETEKGVRFDFISLPAVSNTDAKAPNVTIPVGVHPWDVKSDYSFYSYRQDLEWKDVIYSDVSFTKLSDESVLVRTEIFNNSELMQNCLVNYFSSLQFPFLTSYRVSLPNKSLMFDALDYSEFTYKTSRPWDNETMDAMHKGEFFDDRFTSHRGLGDRDDNRYILPKYPRLGEEKGDKIVYKIKNDLNFSDAALYVRYRTVDNKPSAFTVNGDNVVFPPAQDMGEITMPIGNVDKGDYTLVLVSEGEGGIEFDFFAICEKDETNKILVEAKKNNFVPDVKVRDEINGKTIEIKYEGVEKPFVLRTFNDETRLRSIPSGCLEDVPTPRISQPDKSFDNMMETFSGEFSWKHSDEGYYQNTLVHTLYIEPGKSHTEYAVISYGGAEYETPEDYEKIYLSASGSVEKLSYNDSGKKYEFSNCLLRAAMFQNTVYPLYHHGEYVIHHTPGKRWDSFYTWDSGFIGLDMLEFSPKIADYILDLYLSDKDNKDYAFLLHGSPVPVHLYQYYEMLQKTSDKSELYDYYDRAKMFYDFLAGKINGSTTATFEYFYNCSGMDDLPPQVLMYKNNLQLKTAPCISSSQVIRTAKLLTVIAEHLGKSEDVKAYSEDIKRISNGLQKYAWDDEAGYYSYVIHDETGEAKEQLRSESGENMNKTMDGIYPLKAGITTDEQTGRILSHLKSEDEMMSKVGISAVNMKAGYYATNGYWNGNVWFSHQWFVWKTMLDIGEADFAYKIAKVALDSWKREVEYSYYTFEMLSITTGRGGWFHNFGGLSAPVNIWASAYFKAGTFNLGFDSFCENYSFENDFTHFSADVSHYNGKDSIMLVVMNDKNNYVVTVDGEKAVFNERSKGTFEIKLPSDKKRVKIEIQLV